MSHPAVIATSGLSKDYGSGRGLFELDLEVHAGEVFGFLGPNGAGKSTTMRLLLDLIRPTSGSARVLGLDVSVDSIEIRRRVGFLPGDLAMYAKLPGRAVLDYLGELRGGVDPRVRDSLIERIDADIERPIRQLSTGNRQKLGLIQAFMHEPELLILDEPIAGLDPLVQQSFHALLGEVSAQGRAVFLSSHTLSEVERVTHRLAILRHGRLVIVDSLENLRNVAIQRLETTTTARKSCGPSSTTTAKQSSSRRSQSWSRACHRTAPSQHSNEPARSTPRDTPTGSFRSTNAGWGSAWKESDAAAASSSSQAHSATSAGSRKASSC